MKRTSEYTGIYSRKLSFLQLNCGLGVLRGRGSLFIRLSSKSIDFIVVVVLKIIRIIETILWM